MQFNYKKILPYFIVLLSFCVAIFLIILLIDSVLLPSLIHDKETVKVPNLIGKKLNDAEHIIRENNLIIDKINEQYSETVAEGTVLNQVPKPETIVKENRSIYLTVSKGSEKVTTPNVVGQTLRSVRVLLMNKGLNIGEILYEYDEFYGNDTITNQSIPVGKEVPYGSTINLIISKGSSAQVKVPSLIERSYDEAESILKESGLLLGKVTSIMHDTYLPNTIINQSPQAGTLVNANTAVDIIISK